MISISKEQAAAFMLNVQGLAGEPRFVGEHGVLEFVERAGCIQYDPIDAYGRNADLVLQSRVRGYSKELLHTLLYEKRLLVDHWDKNMSIFRVQDYKYLKRHRDYYDANIRDIENSEDAFQAVLGEIERRGPLCSRDLASPNLSQKTGWYWSATTVARAALESLYFRGKLQISNKRGTTKYYDLTERLIPGFLEADPNPSDEEYYKWQLYRRIGAVGIIWNRPSDAWLGIRDFSAGRRSAAFAGLLSKGKILQVEIKGVAEDFFIRASDSGFMDAPERADTPRAELLAPLDNMLWDRKLISLIFGFDYKWEVYTPEKMRKYAYYTLPLICGGRFAGRASFNRDSKNKLLSARRCWWEDGYTPDDRDTAVIKKCFERFAGFNGCALDDKLNI